MNKTLEKWMNHYQMLIPQTWEKLSSEMMDSTAISAWLTFFQEDEDLYSTTKEKIILEMISSWLNTGKKVIHLRIPNTTQFLSEFEAYPASGIEEKHFRTTASIISSSHECITALTNIKYNQTTKKIYINTCNFMEDRTHLTSHFLEHSSRAIKTQLHEEHEQRKLMLGLSLKKEKNMITTLDDNFERSCVILFAQL